MGPILHLGLMELDRMASRLDLPFSTREKSAVNFREAYDRGLIRYSGEFDKGGIEIAAAASIYAACRSEGLENLDEVVDSAKCIKEQIIEFLRGNMR